MPFEPEDKVARSKDRRGCQKERPHAFVEGQTAVSKLIDVYNTFRYKASM